MIIQRPNQRIINIPGIGVSTSRRAVSVASAEPAPTAGMVLWLKADAITGLSDGDPVSTWPDSSGAGRDFSNTLTARPTYKTSVLNGLPVVRFDGSNDQLLSNASPFPVNCQTWIFVLNATGYTVANEMTGYYNAGFGMFTVGRVYPNINTIYVGDANDIVAYAQNGTCYVNGTNTNNFATAATHKVVSFVRTSAYTPAARFVLGGDTFSRFWAGDFAEVLIYGTALSSGDRVATEAYLKAKYGIA